jgi:hypothetical protein
MGQTIVTYEHAVDKNYILICGCYPKANAHKRPWLTLKQQCSLVLSLWNQGVFFCLWYLKRSEFLPSIICDALTATVQSVVTTDTSHSDELRVTVRTADTDRAKMLWDTAVELLSSFKCFCWDTSLSSQRHIRHFHMMARTVSAGRSFLQRDANKRMVDNQLLM